MVIITAVLGARLEQLDLRANALTVVPAPVALELASLRDMPYAAVRPTRANAEPLAQALARLDEVHSAAKEQLEAAKAALGDKFE